MSQHTESRTHTAAHQGAEGELHTGHPTPATYLKVAMTLTVITAIEVGVFYLSWLGHGIIPILIILSGAKFALVVMFYMHLKYDSPLFSGMFLWGLFVAGSIVLALMALFGFFL